MPSVVWFGGPLGVAEAAAGAGGRYDGVASHPANVAPRGQARPARGRVLDPGPVGV